MNNRDQIYLNLFQAVENLHTEGDGRQKRLAGKLSTLIQHHLETRGLKTQDIDNRGSSCGKR